jgi:hypothetical protein
VEEATDFAIIADREMRLRGHLEDLDLEFHDPLCVRIRSGRSPTGEERTEVLDDLASGPLLDTVESIRVEG